MNTTWAQIRTMFIRCGFPGASCGAMRRRRKISSTWTFGSDTLSPRDFPLPQGSHDQLPPERAGPVFAEPWEAQTFALAVRLSEAGYFSWKEWTEALSGELKAACDRGEPDDGSHYYH